MATTASAVGSPTVNTQAAGTVGARKMRPGTRKPGPGRFNPSSRFQNPGAGSNMSRRAPGGFQGGPGRPDPRALGRAARATPMGGGARQRSFSPTANQYSGPDQTLYQHGGGQQGGGPMSTNYGQYGGMSGPGGQVPDQYQTPGRPGGQPGGGFPGDTGWWRNRPQQPPRRQWGSPQFNYLGGNAPSAQPYGGPNWGGQQGGAPPGAPGGFFGGGQPGGGGQQGGGPMSTNYGQYGGMSGPGGQMGGGGGMPQGGMPNYQTQQFGNQAYGALQNRIYEQQMLSQMPSRMRQQYRFQQGAGGMGYDPANQNAAGQMFQGYGQTWGHTPGGWTEYGSPWSGTWGREAPGYNGGAGQQQPGSGNNGYWQNTIGANLLSGLGGLF